MDKETPSLATPEALARHLGVPLRTIYGWRHRRIGPPAIKVGKHLRYRWSDVEAWEESRVSGGDVA